MRAILIDPEQRSFTEVEYDGDFHSIYGFIDCDTFDAVFTEFGDIYVDDEGLLKNPEYFFEVEGIDQPFAGKGLVFGKADAEGNTTAAKISIDDLEKVIHFTTRQSLLASLG